MCKFFVNFKFKFRIFTFASYDVLLTTSSRVSTTIERRAATGPGVSKELIINPFHPNASFDFKKTKIGLQMRSCKSHWFEAFPWLHYRLESDTVICYFCANQDLKGNLSSATKKETTFIKKDSIIGKEQLNISGHTKVRSATK